MQGVSEVKAHDSARVTIRRPTSCLGASEQMERRSGNARGNTECSRKGNQRA